MTVGDIIEVLKTMPQDAKMGHLWAGAVRTCVDVVYLSKTGVVVGAPNGEAAYYDEDRPDGAPTREQDRYWAPGQGPIEE